MPTENAWRRWGRYGVAVVLAVVVGWFAFIAHREVPFLDGFDLAMHETGHLLTAFAPKMVMFLSGSAAQVLVPLALAWYFGVTRRDTAGGGFCLAWAGASMWDVSVYIADAPIQAFPLIGGGQHDWAFLLGPHGWNVMGSAGSLAGFVEFFGALTAAGGIGVALWTLITRLAGGSQTNSVSAPSPSTGGADEDAWIAATQLPFRYDSVA